MKINIRGDDITPDKIASALASCEATYGLKIKGATIYVRFENDMGQTVDPLKDGEEFSRTFSFWTPHMKGKSSTQPERPCKEIKKAKVDKITANEMFEICKNVAHRHLSNGEMTALIDLANTMDIDRKIFKECAESKNTNTSYFDISYLTSLIRHRCK